MSIGFFKVKGYTSKEDNSLHVTVYPRYIDYSLPLSNYAFTEKKITTREAPIVKVLHMSGK